MANRFLRYLKYTCSLLLNINDLLAKSKNYSSVKSLPNIEYAIMPYIFAYLTILLLFSSSPVLIGLKK